MSTVLSFVLPDTNVRSDAELKALVTAMEKASFSDRKIEALRSDIANHKTKYFSAHQVAAVLKKLNFSSDMEKGVELMNDYIVQLTCADIKEILKCFSFSSDQLKALEILRDLITDAHLENNRKLVIKSFTFSSDQEKAEELLRGITPRRSPLWGKVTYNPVVFVLDISGSMDTKFRTSDGLTRSRLEVSVEELINVLTNQLSPQNSKFNIVLYSSYVTQFYAEPVLATPENKKNAIDRLRGVRAGGGTSTLAALTHALTRNAQLEGIYLLSDGEPTDAQPQQIVASAAGPLQGGRKIPITTIGFFLPEKNPNTRAFMQQLAEATGGLFRAIE